MQAAPAVEKGGAGREGLQLNGKTKGDGKGAGAKGGAKAAAAAKPAAKAAAGAAPKPSREKVNLVMCVVQRGKANDIAKAAMEAGAAGSTIFNARGQGLGEVMSALGFAVAPQKEVIFVVATQATSRRIFDVISKAAHLDTFGQGIAFTMPIGDVAGLFEQSGIAGKRA
jgi:nitrogen regulatory protein PII